MAVDFTNVLSNAVSSITGEVAKAVIKINDQRPADDERLQELEAITHGSAGSAGGTNMKVGPQPSMPSDSGGGIANTLGLDKAHQLSDDPNFNKMFEVQFNPSTFSISGHSGGNARITNYTSQDRSTGMSQLDTYLELSVELIFDQMELGSAFPGDNFNMSASKAIGTAKDFAMGYVDNDSVNSVQVIVEGFIGALRSPYTRVICFAWGDLYYQGQLRRVSSTYTLFDAMGRPVRAKVGLSLILRDSNIKKTEDGLDMGYWQAAYSRAFGKSSTYVSKAQKLGRMIF